MLVLTFKTELKQFQLMGISTFFIVFFITLALTGCVTTEPVGSLAQKDVQTIWPSPPEQARIQYVGSLKNEADVAGQELGLIDRLLGRIPEDESLLSKPYGVFSNSTGKIFVTDAKAKVVVFDLANKSIAYIGQSGPGTLKMPMGITADQQGNVYVSDILDKKIVMFDINGQYIRAFGGQEILDSPAGLAFDDRSKLLYVVDVKKHQIIVFNPDGQVESRIGQNGVKPGEFNYPTNISLDEKNGLLYVADTLNFRVQGFKLDGTPVINFGSNGDRPGDFSRLKGIGIDTEGHIYAVDAAFNNFQIFDEKGQLLMAVGRASQQADGFYLPAGAHVDRNNHIFVVDQYNKRIQMFKYLAESTSQ